MLILSQDRETIFIPESYRCLFINSHYCEYEIVCLVRGVNNGDKGLLGKYKTEERAKEILMEIMKKAEVGNRVYYMPEE